MKLVLIACNEAIDEEVMEMLERAGAHSYTKWTRVLGRGTASGPHLGSHVWPKRNNVLAVACDGETVAAILDGVRGLRARLGKEGLKAFVVPLEDVT